MSSLELPKLFKHFFEIENRKNFDVACGVTIDNFKSLIGEYHFDEEVRCQVKKAGGNCGNNHLHGWLGITKNGAEGLIGGHCAKKYFKADKTFATERNRVKREISISESLSNLRNLLNENSEYIEKVDTEIARIRDLKTSVDNIKANLPHSIVQTLTSFAKTGRNGVNIQIQYVEVDEDGKKHVDWIEQTIGKVFGTSLWLYSNFGGVFTALKDIKATLPEIKIERESGERKLKQWVKVLNGLPDLRVKIDSLQKEFEKFCEPSNLGLLIFLVRNQDQQLEMAKLALAKSGVSEPSNKQARKLVQEYEENIRRENDNRNFRVLR